MITLSADESLSLPFQGWPLFVASRANLLQPKNEDPFQNKCYTDSVLSIFCDWPHKIRFAAEYSDTYSICIYEKDAVILEVNEAFQYAYDTSSELMRLFDRQQTLCDGACTSFCLSALETSWTII